MVSAGDGSGRDTDRALTVAWAAPSNPTGVTGYQLRYKLTTAEMWSEPVPVSGVNSLSYTFTPAQLVPGDYQVSVEAVGGTAHDPVVSTQTATVADPITVSIAPSDLTVPEGDALPLTLTLSGERSETITVGLTTNADTAATSDFAVPPMVSFGVGETSVSVNVEANNDEIVEGTETFTVGIGNIPSGESVDMDAEEVTVEITDDDEALVSVGWAGTAPNRGALPAVAEDTDGGTLSQLSYRVKLDKQVNAAVEVNWELVTSSAVTPADFTTSQLAGQFTFAANSSAGQPETVTIEVADDTVEEAQEAVRMRISVSPVPLMGREDMTPVSVDASASEVIAFIIASDQSDLSILPSGVMVSAGDGMGRDTDRALTAAWTAPEDDDDVTGYRLRYKLTTEDVWSEPISVDANTVAHSWTPVDGLASGSYQVSVEAVGNDHEPVTGTQVAAISPIVAAFRETSLDIDEGDTETITLTLSGGRSAEVVIGLVTTPDSAVAEDFAVPAQTSVSVGETLATVTVSAVADDEDEPMETFTIALLSPSPGGDIVADPAVVTVTINNVTASPPTGGGSPPATGGGSLPTTGGGGGGGPLPSVGGAPTTAPDDRAPTTSPSFTDTIANTHENNIGTLAEMGITRGCNPPSNSRFCPDRAVTRGEMATFMVRAFGLSATSENLFGDDDGNTHESNINRLATAEITRGCNPPENTRYCPDRPVTRAQMATFISRALDLAEGSGDFADTAGSVHSNDINRIAVVGITRGCNPPANSRYCPDRPVTRAEMATFLIRATDLLEG